MRWKRIEKPKAWTKAGKYSDWKPELAAEGDHRCVYCSVRDQALGGTRFFHVEHYRPKKHFPGNKHDYYNLFYSCAICNIFKGSLWFDHDEGDWNCVHFPDPSKIDYSEFFEIGEKSELRGNHTAARYLIEVLHLNRSHLIRERRFELAVTDIGNTRRRVSDLTEKLKPQIEQGDEKAIALLLKAYEFLDRYAALWEIKDGLPLYYPRELS